MNWEDECYLLSKRKFRENGNIINIFSRSKGKVHQELCMVEILEKLETIYKFQINCSLSIIQKMIIKAVILKQNLLNLFLLFILMTKKEPQL